jgi:predicted CopG family antitoxin
LSKSVRVHDDTHRALKELKARRRSGSLDQVVRELIREATGSPVEEERLRTRSEELTSYADG